MTRDPVRRYAEQVAAGRIVAGRLHRAACLRFLRDLDTARDRGLIWVPRRAARVVEFFSHLQHYKGEWAGQPLALAPWQVFLVGQLHGWIRAHDGTRRIRTAFVELQRGNGKTTLAAGLALWAAFFDGEPAADVFMVATKRDQARICFETARQIVRRVPALQRRIHVGQHNLHERASASKLEPLGADADTLDGLRPHLVVADEVHAQKDSDLINTMMTGMGTRRQPLMLEITTAGIARTGPWWVHREYARQILEGRHDDDTWLAFIAGADAEDDWTDPRIWAKANPNYGRSVKPEYLAAECRKAQRMPTYQAAFRRLHVGQLVEQAEKVIDRAAWDRAGVPGLRLDETYRRRVCFGGLDLSSTTDLTACVLLFPEDSGGYTAFPWFWVPADNVAARVERDHVPYDVWAREGWLRLTAGNICDYDVVRLDLVALVEDHALDLRVLGYDPSNATQLATQLAGELGDDRVLSVPQGFRHYDDACKRLIALVAAERLRHPAHPVLTWNADNLTLAFDSAGRMRPDKARAIERIDGMVALLLALGRAIATVTLDPVESAYASHGVDLV